MLSVARLKAGGYAIQYGRHCYAAGAGEFPGGFGDEPGNQGVGNQALAAPVSGKLLSQPGQVLRAGMDRGDHGERVADHLDGGSVKVRSRDLGRRRMRAIPVATASLPPLAAAGLAHRVPPGKRIHPSTCPDEGTFEPDPRGRLAPLWHGWLHGAVGRDMAAG